MILVREFNSWFGFFKVPAITQVLAGLVLMGWTLIGSSLTPVFSAENLLKDGGMETLGEPDSAWCFTGTSGAPSAVSAENEPFSGPVGAVERADGNRFLRVKTEEKGMWGAVQEIVLETPTMQPLRFGGRACVNGQAEALSTGRADFDVYIDAFYEDGTPLWSQKAVFSTKVNGWQNVSEVIWPEKPLKRIKFFVFFRDHVGSASFDDFFIESFSPSLDRFQAIGGLTGDGSLAVSGRLLWNVKFWTDDFRAELCELKGGNVPSESEEVVREIPLEFQPDRLTFSALAAPTEIGGVKTFRFRIWNDGQIVQEKVFSCDTSSPDDAPFSLWIESPMRRVYLNTFPESETRKLAPQLALARGESESFQLAVLSGEEIPAVTLEFSDLISTENPAVRLSADSCEWQQVGYLKTALIVEHPMEKNGRPLWYPDPLLPRKTGFVPANQTASFWVTVSVPETAQPGTYRGTLKWIPTFQTGSEFGAGADTASDSSLTSALKPVEIPLEVHVFPVTIPKEGHLGNAFALMDGFLESVYGKCTDEELRELHRVFGEFMLRYRLTPEGDISRTTLPDSEFLEAWRDRGLGTFNILNMVFPRGDQAWRCNSPLEFYTPENREKMLDRLRPCVEKLREMGLSDRAYIYTFDETNEAFNAAMTDFFGMVKENFPEVATFTTARIATEPEVMKRLNVDWACPLTSSYDLEKAEACRKEGLKVWSYICCGPRDPYANIMLRFPLIESRILGWQSFEQKYDGLLYWGVNIWSASNNRPMDPNETLFWDWETAWKLGDTWIYGDGRLLYPGIGGTPIGCTRLANLRDAYEDYELLWQLNQKNPELARKICAEVFTSPVEFTREPEVLERQHRALLEALFAQ